MMCGTTTQSRTWTSAWWRNWVECWSFDWIGGPKCIILTDSRTRTGNIYIWNTLFFAVHDTACVSPRVREAHTECPYIHLLIYIRFASSAMKTNNASREQPGSLSQCGLRIVITSHSCTPCSGLSHNGEPTTTFPSHSTSCCTSCMLCYCCTRLSLSITGSMVLYNRFL